MELSVVERLRLAAQAVDEAAGYVEGIGIAVVARVAPWVATFPTAYTVYAESQKYLGWTPLVALTAGAAVETLGLAMSALALRMRRYNLARRKTDEIAPAWIGYGLMVVYFVAAEALVVGLEIVPQVMAAQVVDFSALVPAIFPVLSLAATVTMALRDEQGRRERGIAADKAERKAARQGTKRTAQRGQRPAIKADAGPDTEPVYARITEATKTRAKAILAERSGISGSELGRLLGKSDRTGRRLKALLAGENGRGMTGGNRVEAAAGMGVVDVAGTSTDEGED